MSDDVRANAIPYTKYAYRLIYLRFKSLVDELIDNG